MYINLKKLKVPEIRKLAKAYNKLNNIPHPSTLKKSELITYLKEHLETNKKGHILIDHPKLQKSIQSAIDRLKEEYDQSKKELEKLEKEIRADIEKYKSKQKAPEPSFRDSLSKEERDAQDRRMKHLIETGQFLFEKQPERKRTKKEIEREKAITKQLDEERKAEQEARSKRNQEIMKKVREEMKAEFKSKPKKPTKKKEQPQPEEEEEEEDDDMTPEEKRMQAYFASIKDPQQRMKEVKEYMMKQRKAIRKKVQAKEAKEAKEEKLKRKK